MPGEPVSNDDLSRVIHDLRRVDLPALRYPPAALRAGWRGVSDLACEAAKRAIESARIAPSEIDYILFATMTPDYIFPGSGALLGAKLGIPGVPALDIRQCAAMLFGLQTINGLIQTGAAKTILFVGAEAHAGFMPWEDWGALDPKNGRSATPEARARTRTATGTSPSCSGTGRARWSSARPIATRACAATRSAPMDASPSSSTCRAAASARARTGSRRRSTRTCISPAWMAASSSSSR